MNDKNNSLTYNLYSTERRYKDETLISFYFQPNSKIIKKFSPIDINGERYKLDLQSGEVKEYTKKEMLSSFNASLRRTTILMNMLLSMNDFDWFWTLTFDKEKINRYDDQQVFNCYKKYIDNLKHKFPNFKYMCFPERHENNCIHFHLLTSDITAKQMGLVNSGKVCCHWAMKGNKKIGLCSREHFEKTKHLHQLKETDGEPIYNITTFAFGYTTVSRICSRERCNSYVKKYVEKALGSTETFKKRFYYSSNLNVPDIVKKLIGADFEGPKEIEELSCLQDNLFVKNAKGQPYVSDYNVMQVRINNAIKDYIDKGLIPLTEKEILELGGIF